MNEQLKRRLIGATVLMTLAVLLLPLILDGSGHRESESSEVYTGTVQFRFETPEAIAEPALAASAAIAPLAAGSPTINTPPAAAKPVSSAPPPRPAPVPPAAPKPPPTPPKPVAASPVAPPPVAAVAQHTPPRSAAETPPDGSRYIVQLGSFGQSSNALTLRDRLRSSGFTAYVEKFDEGRAEPIYRVRVGPQPDRRGAENLRSQIRQKLGLSGLVMMLR